MGNGIYETVLEELGHLLSAGKLQPDRNSSCVIKLISGLEVYIEMDRSADFLILMANLGNPGVGKYREELFRAALITNGMSHPLHGILAFSDNSNQVLIYEKISLEYINGDRVLEHLLPFEEKANKWREAISRNEVPHVGTVQSSSRLGGGIFGLRP